VIPFWLPKVVALAAGAVFVFGSDASRRAKVALVLVVLLSLILEYGIGSRTAWAAALVLQAAVGVFVLVHFRIYR
jgi:hypothetical protein